MTAVIVLLVMVIWGGMALVIGWSMGYEYGKARQAMRVVNLCDALTTYAAECYELRQALLAKEVDEALRGIE